MVIVLSVGEVWLMAIVVRFFFWSSDCTFSGHSMMVSVLGSSRYSSIPISIRSSSLSMR